MTVTVRAEFRTTPTHLAEFLDGVARIVARTADEPGTLRFDWFHGDGPTTFVVLEEYVDGDAALAHNAHSADLVARVHELAELTAIALHGDLGPRLAAEVESFGVARVHPPVRWGDIS